MNSRNYRVSPKTVALSLAIATLVVLVYSMLTSSYVALFSLNPYVFATALTMYVASWIVSAYRLKILHMIMDGGDKQLRFIDYCYARFIGGLMACLTPSSIGGEPGRAYYIYLKMGENFSRYMALSIYETLLDIFFINIVCIGFSIIYLPLTIPVILFSTANLILGILTYYLFNNIVTPEKANPILRKILLFIENNIVGRVSTLSNGYKGFGSAFRELSTKTKFMHKALLMIITFIMHLLTIATICVIYLSTISSNPLQALLQSLSGYFFSQSMGSLPTPGGSGGVEYGLSITLNPRIVVVARTMMYYAVIIIGFIVLIKTGIAREIIK